MNKNLILTFFLIFLAISLLKNKGQFNERFSGRIKGCIISNPANVKHYEIYNCLIKQTKSIVDEFTRLKQLNSSSQYAYIKKIMNQIKNYFIMLFDYNLEKYYKGILFIAAAPHLNKKTPHSVVKFELPDMVWFMNGQHNQDDIFKLRQPLRLYSKSGINTVNQIGYLLVPPGYKLALSTPDNNRNGRYCYHKLRNPNNPYAGSCIPGNLRNYNSYLPGGRIYSINDLMYHFNRTNRQTIVWRREPLWMNERNALYFPRGAGNRAAYQKNFNWHTSVDDTMGSCWLGTDKPAQVCHYAYGNVIFKHFNIIPDVNFFNKYLATKEIRNKIRTELRNGNYNSLNGFFG